MILPADIFANISKGNITWIDLAQCPAECGNSHVNDHVRRAIRQTLEQQWQAPLPSSNLIVSGVWYTYDAAKPPGSKLISVSVNGVPLDLNATYTVATVDTLTLGDDGYTTFGRGSNMSYGPVDVNALVSYVRLLPQPVNVTTDGRIQRIN